MSAPSLCTVCRHTLVDQINEDLLKKRSVRWVANKFNLSKTAVHRHNTGCLLKDYDALIEFAKKEAQVVDAQEQIATDTVRSELIQKVMNGAYMVQKIDDVVSSAEGIRDRAIEEDSPGVALQANNTILKGVDSYAKLAAEAREREKMREESIRAEWESLKGTIMKVLDRYPEAKKEVMDELSRKRSVVFN